MTGQNGNGGTSVKSAWFERELIAASGVTTLEEAAPQWELVRYELAHNGIEPCQVCHTPLVWVAVIRNCVNDVYLRIGCNCYDKLLVFLKTKKVMAVTLPSRGEYTKKVRNYLTDQLAGMPCRKNGIIAAMTKWFEAQSDLPEPIATILVCIQRLGHSLTMEDAEAFVEYYKTHRLIHRWELLTDLERRLLETFPYRRRLPEYITLAALPKLRQVLISGKQVAELRQERVREAWEEAWKQERTEFAGGVGMSLVAITQWPDYAHASFFCEKSERRGFDCVVSGLGSSSGLTSDDIKATAPNHARLICPERRPYSLSEIVVVVMDSRDLEAWIQRAMWYRDMRVVQAETTAVQWMEQALEEKPNLYIRGALKQYPHPRGGAPEWQMRAAGEKFILQRGENYDEKDGPVYLRITKELGRNIYLVARLRLNRGKTPFRWYYNTYYTGNITENILPGIVGSEMTTRSRFIRNQPTTHFLEEE